MPLKTRQIVCLSIPAFPVAIERVREKALRGRPVAVAQTDSARSRCLSISEEARRMGVRVGLTVGEARKRCRDLVVRETDVDLYRRAQEAIGKVVAEFSPLVEPGRSGRHFLDLTGSERLFGSTRSIAETIRKRIINNLTIPADAGIAANKLVSRVASFDALKSDLIEVPCGTEQTYLAPHQVEVLPSVIKDTRTRLFDLNIRVVDQVHRLSNDLLLAAVGPPAFLLARQSQGIDPSPVTPPGQAPHIVLAQELPEDSNNRDTIELVIHNLTLDGILRLANSGWDAGELIMTLTYSDQKSMVKSISLAGNRSIDSLFSASVGLYDGAPFRRVRIRRVELDFLKLVPHVDQGDLFKDNNSPIEKKENTPGRQGKSNRVESLIGAMNLIRSRFGSSAIAWGM